MEVTFTVPGEPFGKQRPRFTIRNNKTYTRTPTETSSYESAVKWFYLQQTGYMFPDDVPIRVKIYAYFSIPKSDSKKKKQLKLQGKIFPIKKPDWDNIGKIICDSLNGIAYKDDSHIVEAEVHKRFSNNPRVEVVIDVVLEEKGE